MEVNMGDRLCSSSPSSVLVLAHSCSKESQHIISFIVQGYGKALVLSLHPLDVVTATNYAELQYDYCLDGSHVE